MTCLRPPSGIALQTTFRVQASSADWPQQWAPHCRAPLDHPRAHRGLDHNEIPPSADGDLGLSSWDKIAVAISRIEARAVPLLGTSTNVLALLPTAERHQQPAVHRHALATSPRVALIEHELDRLRCGHRHRIAGRAGAWASAIARDIVMAFRASPPDRIKRTHGAGSQSNGVCVLAVALFGASERSTTRRSATAHECPQQWQCHAR